MSPPRLTAHGEGSEAILEAAVRVVADRGLRGLTFRAVADAAGVSNTLIAYHFGTRDRLIQGALDWSVERSLRATAGVDASAGPGEYARRLRAMLDANPDLQSFQYEMILEAKRRGDLVTKTQRLYHGYVAALVADALAMGLAELDEDGARLAFAALDGLVLQYITHAIGPVEFDRATDRLWRWIDQGSAVVAAAGLDA